MTYRRTNNANNIWLPITNSRNQKTIKWISKMFKGKKKLNSLTKIHFKNEGKIKTFLDSRCTLKKTLKMFLAEGKWALTEAQRYRKERKGIEKTNFKETSV